MTQIGHQAGAPRGPQRGEEGFTLIEVIVAGMVILIVMLSVGAVLIGSLGDVAYARQSQGADHLMDQALEQIRALPFTTLEAGLYNADPTVTSDPAISGGSYQGRTLLMSTSQPPAPLYPHQTTVRQSSPSTGTYTIDVYPTAYTGAGAGIVQVSVVVSWNRAARPGRQNYVTGQTLVYSPSAGCLAPTDHPFAAPCQPFLYANPVTGSGGITVTPDTVSGGLSSVLKSAQLVAPSASVDLQSEQIASVSSSATSPGYLIDTGSGPVAYGGGAVNSYADNQPGGSTSTYTSNSGPGATTGSQAVNAPNGTSLTLSGTGAVNATTAVAASAASATQPCSDLGGTPDTTGLACGSAQSATASGSPLTATATVPVGGSPLALTLASLTDSVAAFAGRAVTTGATFCTATSGDGCVRAATQRSAFSLGLGGIPASLSGSLPGWTGNFLQISAADATTAESGISPAAPTAGPSPTVSVYSSAAGGYVTPTPGTLPAPLTVSGTVNGQAVVVSMTLQDLTVGAASTTSTGCSSTCEKATVTSPVVADLDYTVTVAGSEVFGTVLHVDLGAETSATSYKAAPVAG